MRIGNKEIYKSISNIESVLREQHVTLERNTRDVKHHVRRTNLLEAKINSWPHKASLYLSLSTGFLMFVQKLLVLFH